MMVCIMIKKIYREKEESVEDRLKRLDEEYKRKKNWGTKN